MPDDPARTTTSVPQAIARSLPVAAIVLTLAGLAAAFAMGRPDYAERGLVIAVPIVASSLVLYVFGRTGRSADEPVVPVFAVRQTTLVLVYAILLTLSIGLLIAFPSRPILYFLAATALFVVIFFQILGPAARPVLVIPELVLGLLCLTYGVTLKYPLFFGATDIPAHFYLAEITAASGHIVPEELSIGYAQFPLYHVLGAMAGSLIGQGTSASIFLVTGLFFAVTTVFVYYLFLPIVGDSRTTMLACLSWAASNVAVYSAAYMVTRTMAFVGFAILLYLLYRRPVSGSIVAFRALAIVVVAFTLLVHQVSIVQIAALLALLLVSEAIADRYVELQRPHFVALVLIFLGYWLYSARGFIDYVVATHLSPELFASIVLKTGSVDYFDIVSFLQANIASAIFLLLGIVGAGYLLLARHRGYLPVFGLFALASLVFYAPTPLKFVQQWMDVLRFDRFMLLVSPFMGLVMAFGIVAFVQWPRRPLVRIVAVAGITLLFAVFCLGSMAAENIASDSDDLWRNSSRLYFPAQDLSALRFVDREGARGTPISSDYFVLRYFGPKSQFRGSREINATFFETRRILAIDDVTAGPGLAVLRSGELLERGRLVFGSATSPQGPAFKSTDENVKALEDVVDGGNKVYASGASFVLWGSS